MIKNFIANIPFYLSTPFQLLSKLCSFIVKRLILAGGKLHMKLKTPTGVALIKAEQQLLQLEQDLKTLTKMSKKLNAQKRTQSDPTLQQIISNGEKNGPTYH